MATGGYFVLPNKAEADIDTPPTGYVALFNDADDSNTPAYKDDAAVVHSFVGGTGPAGPGYTATSTTSLAIGTGSKTFTTQAGLAYSAGARVRATSAAAPTVDYMEGVVTSYTTTSLVVTMDLVGGSGTHTDWDINLAGDQGVPGAGVPPTVVSHGNMGATETFDYGDGPAHEGTVNASLTVTLSGFVAGECILTLGFTTDGTGGYGVPDFPAAVVNEADLAAVWDDTAGAYNLIVLRTVDSGTTVYIVGLPPDPQTLDAVLAVSSGENIADALSGAASPAAGNVFATMADVGGGSFTHTYLGYNTVGGSTAAWTAYRTFFKKITVASAGVLNQIEFYTKANANGATPALIIGLWDDASGAPGHLIQACLVNLALLELTGNVKDPRWLGAPIGRYVTAADYWVGVQVSTASWDIYYDGSGSDQYHTVGGSWLADGSYYTLTTTSNKYSIRASLLT